MKRKTIMRAIVGFLLGALSGLIIAYIFAYINGSDHLFDDSFINRFGSQRTAFVVQMLFSGLYGAICFSSMGYYEVEDWGLLKATVLHCLTINLSFLIIGLFLEWIPFDMKVIAFSSLLIVGCFFIIWIIMYVRNKREVKKLNELLHEEENRTEEE